MSIVITGLLILSLMVVVHELGHLLAARTVGIQVEEFSLGMGPALLKFSIGGTVYCLRLFPIGGYVKFIDEDGTSGDVRAFSNAKVWKRIFVIAAGPAASFLLAVVLFAVSAMTFGEHTRVPEVREIHESAPAEQAGLSPGDRIVQIDDVRVNHAQPDEGVTQIHTLLEQNQGQPISLLVERGGEEVDLTITPRFDSDFQRFEAGFVLGGRQQHGLFTAIGYGLVQTHTVIMVAFHLLESVFIPEDVPPSTEARTDASTGEYAGGFVGPVGLAGAVGDVAAQHGIEALVLVAGVITIAVGLFNLIPFPPLDGGKLALLFVEGIRRKPLNPKIEIPILVVGTLLLLGFLVWVTIGDIRRIF